MPRPASCSQIGKNPFQTSVNLESWVTIEPGLRGRRAGAVQPKLLGSVTAGTGRKDGSTLELTLVGQILERAAELLEAIDAYFEEDVDGG